jgi:hypothetical protein
MIATIGPLQNWFLNYSSVKRKNVFGGSYGYWIKLVHWVNEFGLTLDTLGPYVYMPYRPISQSDQLYYELSSKKCYTFRGKKTPNEWRSCTSLLDQGLGYILQIGFGVGNWKEHYCVFQVSCFGLGTYPCLFFKEFLFVGKMVIILKKI